jgi:hypothetical protein
MIILAILMYWIGETKRKEFKYAMGIPIGICGAAALKSWVPLLCVVTYFLATWVFGYGDNNRWTKWIGKRWAITLTGIALGLASAPILHYWSMLAGLVSGGVFYYVDKKQLQEPWVAILRGAAGTICLMII